VQRYPVSYRVVCVFSTLLGAWLSASSSLVLVFLCVIVVASGSTRANKAVDRVVYVFRDHLRLSYSARRGILLRPKSAKPAVVCLKPVRFVAPDCVAVRFVIRMEYSSSVIGW
jgi:hypothetical protein